MESLLRFCSATSEEDGTDAVCIGLDETVETDWTLEECKEAALYRA